MFPAQAQGAGSELCYPFAHQRNDFGETRSFRRNISIPPDGMGLRQVRVEYRDAQGRHAAVIDEPHDEGDRIPISFEYVGKNITLEVYYDERKVFDKTFDPQATRNEKIRDERSR